ncbi:MAG: hypothetical protein JSS49_01815 [Planctomycetes bacterium]|nr:hypothetical protein [Planctomycetota bacterium]
MRTSKLQLVLAGLVLMAPVIVEAQQKTDKRLLQKISIDVNAKPVSDVLKELGEKYKIPVEFDPSVEANGLGSSPFTLTAEGLMLGSVLHLACESGLLEYTMEKGRMVVTAFDPDEKMTVREYPIGTLGNVIDLQLFAAELVGLTSGHWMDIDGEGGAIVAIKPQSFTIQQTPKVHAELKDLFDQISAVVSGRPRVQTVQDRADQLIVRKLQTPSLLPAGDLPLAEILDQMLKKNGIAWWIDQTAMDDEGIDWKKLSFTVEAKKITPAARLDAMTSEHKLAWRVADEVVQITTAAKADEQLTVQVYDVRKANRPITVLSEQLTSNKELGPWQNDDGEGGSVLPLGTSLVIRQTAKNHAKIAKLLK